METVNKEIVIRGTLFYISLTRIALILFLRYLYYVVQRISVSCIEVNFGCFNKTHFHFRFKTYQNSIQIRHEVQIIPQKDVLAEKFQI